MALINLMFQKVTNKDGTITVSVWDPAKDTRRYTLTQPAATTNAQFKTALEAMFVARKAAGLDYPTSPDAAPTTLAVDIT